MMLLGLETQWLGLGCPQKVRIWGLKPVAVVISAPRVRLASWTLATFTGIKCKQRSVQMDIPLRTLSVHWCDGRARKGWAVRWTEGSDDNQAFQQDHTFRRTRHPFWEDLDQQSIWGPGEISSGLQTAFVAIRRRQWCGCYRLLELWQSSCGGSSETHNGNSWRRTKYFKEGIYTILRQLSPSFCPAWWKGCLRANQCHSAGAWSSQEPRGDISNVTHGHDVPLQQWAGSALLCPARLGADGCLRTTIWERHL